MTGEDWLTLPGDEKPAASKALKVFAGMVSYLRTVQELNGEPPKETALDNAPATISDRNHLIERAWNGLSPMQRMYLEEYERQGCNHNATMRALGDRAPNPATVTSWKRLQDFAFVLKVRRTAQAAELLDKNGIVTAAGAIREAALEPKPILYQGVPTGYTEHQPDVALRANEQLAKLGGHLKQEDGGQMGQGPALIIQVVQRDGAIVDVTPKGVTIDLPGPSGA